jgi:mannose-6-phosphate isomerase-like protein (cupin superfamily)
MQILHHHQTEIHDHGATCSVTEYPLGNPSLNVAIVKLSGRYPTSGHAVNTVCKEFALVIDGTGSVVINGILNRLTKGDLVLIEPNEQFYWDGHITLIVPCTPAWYPEQYKTEHSL